MKAWTSNANTMSRKPDRNHQEAPIFSCLNGAWFVVSGEEPTLELLEKKWSAVNYQTNWTLDPVLGYCDSEPVIASQPGDSGQVSNQPTLQPPAITIAIPSEITTHY